MVMKYLHVQDFYDSWQPETSKLLEDFISLNTGFVSLLRLSTSETRRQQNCAHKRTVHWTSLIPATPPVTAEHNCCWLPPTSTHSAAHQWAHTYPKKIIRYFLAYPITAGAIPLMDSRHAASHCPNCLPVTISSPLLLIQLQQSSYFEAFQPLFEEEEQLRGLRECLEIQKKREG